MFSHEFQPRCYKNAELIASILIALSWGRPKKTFFLMTFPVQVGGPARPYCEHIGSVALGIS